MLPVPWSGKTMVSSTKQKERLSFVYPKVVAVEGVNMYSGVIIPSTIYEVYSTRWYRKEH